MFPLLTCQKQDFHSFTVNPLPTKAGLEIIIKVELEGVAYHRVFSCTVLVIKTNNKSTSTLYCGIMPNCHNVLPTYLGH
jgi:hypothetical protein